MLENFIIANGLNETELSRSLAKFWINTIGLRVVTSYDFAKIALERSGNILSKKIINDEIAASVIYSFIKDIDYFKNASYVDAQNICKTFSQLRQLNTNPKELESISEVLNKSDFKKKNQALLQALSKYLQILNSNGLTDNDSLLHKAISLAKPIGAKVIILKEYPLSPLETKMINALSCNSYQKKSISELFNLKNQSSKNPQITKSYGAINEVQDILGDIYSKNKNLDTCIIACENTKCYSQLLYGMSQLYDIPITYGCGLPITNSNPAKLLIRYINWDKKGYHGVDALFDLLSCDALNFEKLCTDLGFETRLDINSLRKFCEYAGYLKISTDAAYNDVVFKNLVKDSNWLGASKNLAKILELGITNFIENYCYIRPSLNVFDKTAMKKIKDSISTFVFYNPAADISEIVNCILQKNICNEISSEGHLHITNLDGLNSTLRTNVYFCGMSANEFPGKQKENYLLLDSEIELFEDGVTSSKKILDKIDSFWDTYNFVNGCMSNIKISYDSYNLAELKEQNASSVIYDLLDNANKECREVGFFNLNFSPSSEVCKKYINGFSYSPISNDEISLIDENLLDRSWSATAIENYFNCPRKFYFSNVLKLPEIKEHDVFEVLDPASFGSLAHKMMELLGNDKSISKDNFVEICTQAFENELLQRPPILLEKKKALLKEFVEMMKRSYDVDVANNNKILFKEEDVEALHAATGLKIHGFPDRIESSDIGDIVVDFKTMRSTNRKSNNVEECLQVMIYAWLMEENGLSNNIIKGEYRYLRWGKSVSCVYNEDTKEQLFGLFEEFADGLKDKNFCANQNNCKYCCYEKICNWYTDNMENAN